MTKRNKSKRQTMTYKLKHCTDKIKVEEHEHHKQKNRRCTQVLRNGKQFQLHWCQTTFCSCQKSI